MLNLLLIGWITVVSSVGGADVMVDEQDGIHMQGREICLEVQEGRHLIMVDKTGYLPYQDIITVQAGVNHEIEIVLEPNYHANHLFRIRWGGIGAAIGTGLDIHASLFNMRWGWFTLEPCLWGMNTPLISDVSHVKTPWLVHPANRRDAVVLYETAIPTHAYQFYYTPMVGIQIPIGNRIAIALGAGPQISWTKINWSIGWRENPFYNYYSFTDEAFPKNGFQFDPVWFSAQIGLVFRDQRSDMMTFFKYQDGYFLGIEYRF